jgi:Ran GTPase-activating protein (RanGAP) involved in mRNA processing and transport
MLAITGFVQRVLGTKLLAEALTGNQIMTELNLSSNHMTADGLSGVVALADAIPDMGALLFLDISDNQLAPESGWIRVDYHGFKAAGDMVDYNGVQCPVSSKFGRVYKVQDISGISALADAIKDNGALSVLSLQSNGLEAEGGKALAEGLKGNHVITELNIADNDLACYNGNTSGAIALADAIPDMRALLSLDISNNQLLYSPNGEAKAAGKALADALAENTVLTVLDVSANCRPNNSLNDGAGFALLLAAGLENNGALAKLDISNNHIGAGQERHLQRICMAGGIELAK